MVRYENRSRTLTGSPAADMAPARATARMESPPRSKKLSSTPTAGTSSTSRQICASRRSRSVRGARKPAPVDMSARPGAGNARLSSFPLVVSGNDARATNADGIMYSGRVRPRSARSRSGSSRRPASGTR